VTDALIDDLLDEYVPAVRQLPQWEAVLRRARRPRRRAAIVASLAAAVLLPAGIGVADGWFTGKPAPPEIRQRFREFDAFEQAMQAAEAKRGLREKAPIAIARKAYGVLALDTPDGPVYLWAAPERGSAGLCSVLQVYVKPRRTPLELTGCDARRRPILEASVYGGAAFPSGNFVQGRASGGAVSVLVELSNGERLRLPVRRTFFLGHIPKHTHPVRTTSYDAAGGVVARRAGH
jgi:hypothetical protein